MRRLAARAPAARGPRSRERYARALRRFRYGPGAFKLDWALSGPIPWRDERCARAATVHLGGTLDEIAASERGAGIAERPFVLLAQPSLWDDTRAPAGKHTGWAYCHVPNGSTVDMTDAIEAQVERFAPGFRDRILARSARGPAELEAHNRNLVGGDLNGGLMDLRQLYARPVAARDPYRTPIAGRLSLQRVDAARRRRARHVRLRRGEGRRSATSTRRLGMRAATSGVDDLEVEPLMPPSECSVVVRPVRVRGAADVPVRAVVGEDHPVGLQRLEHDARLLRDSPRCRRSPSAGRAAPIGGSDGSSELDASWRAG